jgi:type I restriction enzyme, S subunit
MKSAQTKYKTTNIPWLPTVPQHWVLVKTKFLFNERVQKGFDAEPLLAATQTQGVIPKSLYETNTVTAQKDFHLLKLVTVGDFVISLRSFQGGIEYAYYRGIISPAYTVFFSKNTQEVNPQFYRYFFKSEPFVKSLTLFVTGIREGQNIDYNEFKNSLLPLPPMEEQTAIANYLDAQNEKINLFISKKQNLIELLKEQKQAVVTEYFSNDYPKIKLKFLIKGKLKYGANESGEEFNEAYPRYIRITDFGDNGKLRDDEKLSLKPEVAKEYLLKDGDVLFARSGGTVGKTYQFKADNYSFVACYAGYLIKAEPDPRKILSDFLFLYTQSGLYESWKQSIFNKATIENIGADKYSQLFVPVPDLQIQKEIIGNIKVETKRIDEAISRIEKEIELIKDTAKA